MLKNELKKDINKSSFDTLEYYVHKKIEFNRQVLEIFKKQGKRSAELIVNSGRGKLIRDSIIAVSNKRKFRQLFYQLLHGHAGHFVVINN
jgi:CHASE3 domain sensor protein